MQPSTIEMVTFKTKTNVTKDQLVATSPAMEEFLKNQPGFLYRSLSEYEELWYDIIYWRSEEEAKTAGEKFVQHPAGQAIMSLVDIQTTAMRHMQAVAESMGDPQDS